MASSQSLQLCSSSTIAKEMQRRGRVGRDQASGRVYPTKTKPPVA
jgi:hypothetical protein